MDTNKETKKKLRTGFTTGSCATASSKAGILSIINQKKIEQTDIILPKRSRLNIKINSCEFTKNSAKCSVIKDGGDDPDVTHGAEIIVNIELTNEIGETCGIAIPNGTEMIYYDRVQTDWPLQIHLQVGSHTPTWCTASGKLYLSSINRDRRLRLTKRLPLKQYTRNTIVDSDILEKELGLIRKTGIGTDNEEFVDGMVACAVPVLDRHGKLFACLFTHAPVIRKSLDELLGYVPMLTNAAMELSRLIDDPDGDLEGAK